MGNIFFKHVKNKANFISPCKKCTKQTDENLKLTDCHHTFCPECLCEYLESFSTAKICCPSEGCDQIIPDHIVRECLSDPQLEIYDIFCLPSIKLKCLIKDCVFYVARDSKEGHFICGYCKQPNCVTCSNLHLLTEPCGPSKNKDQYESNASKNLSEKRRLDLLSESSGIIWNFEKSNCGICDKFLLPRKGILVIPCMDNFCGACLKEYLKDKEVNSLKCPNCESSFSGSECRELLGCDRLQEINLKAVEQDCYVCPHPDCTAMWDPGDFKGLHICDICNKINCMSCKGIHEGQTCSEYKEKMKSILLKEEEVSSFYMEIC